MNSTHHQKQTKFTNQDNIGNLQDITQFEHYQGSIPHPDILKKFDEVVSGAANRLIEMAENEQKHRHQLERKIFTSEIALKIGGLITAGLITLCFLGSGMYLIINDKSTQGLVLLIAPLVPLLATFFYKNSKCDVKK